MFDAGGRVVAPGFVDAHAHPVFAGDARRRVRAARRGRDLSGDRGGGRRHPLDRRRTRAASEDELFADVEAARAVVPAHGHDDRRGEVGLRPHGRGRVEDAARRAASERGGAARVTCRPSSARTRCRTSTARAARSTSISSSKRCCRASPPRGWRSSATCSARSASSRRRVAARFCSAARARGLGLRVHADQLSLVGRRAARRRAGREDRRPPRTHGRARHRGAARGGRAAGASARLGLRARLEAVPGGARDDRARASRSSSPRTSTPAPRPRPR